MTGKSHALFISAFCLIIFGVGITQAIVEIRRGETVQMLDLAEDTFVTPVRRANELSVLFDTLSVRVERLRVILGKSDGEENGEEVSTRAEEALAGLEELQRRALRVNRHITIDTSGSFPPFGKVLRILPLPYDEIVTRSSMEHYFRTISGMSHALQRIVKAGTDGDMMNAREALATVDSLSRVLAPIHVRRSVLAAPVLALEHFFLYTAFSQRYLRAWENEMEKTSVFENALRPPFQFLRYAVLHDVTEKAVLGRDGWLFYKPDVEYLYRPYVRDPRSIVVDPNDNPLTDDPIDAIVRFKRQLEARGVELLVVIVPGKPSIYPDMINKRVPPRTAGTFSHSLRTMQELRDSGVAVVDLFGPFGEERQRDSEAGDSMYLSKDTHWRARGVRLAARLVAERIRTYSWYRPEWETVNYVLDTVTVERVGDVGTMTALPNLKIRELRLRFETEPTLCYQVFEVRQDPEGREERIPYRDDLRRSKILVLGDSFSRIYQTDAPRSAGWIAHLAYELKQPVASIVSDGGASTLVRQSLARRPEVLRGKKLVVWEFVERDLRFGAEGWKDVALGD